MNDRTKDIIKPLLNHTPIIEYERVIQIIAQFSFDFPVSYIDVIKFINGSEGEIGRDSWLILFPLEELAEVNHDYRLLMENIPDYFLVGKDAADTGYAFHKIHGTFHSFGLMSSFKRDPIHFMGNNFYEFLEILYNYRFKG